MKIKIKNKVNSIFHEIVSWREHLHAHPELSFKEFKTVDFISEKLSEFGIHNQVRMAKTGLVALIKGHNSDKKCIALRADIDALPITETNDVSYKSKVNGIMHACGHDAHTACLLGAAKVLQSLKNDFEGTIKLIFQPGEELLPGGASLMISEGVLKNPNVNQIIALHVLPNMKTGHLGFRKGKYMAACDELYLNVVGKGGHAAIPSQYKNPISLISELLIEMDLFVKSICNDTPYIFVFGDLHAYGATNVIPENAHAKGTLRTFDELNRQEIHDKLKKFVLKFLGKRSFQGSLDIEKGYPFLYNDIEFTNDCIKYAQEYFGKENIKDLDIRMTAEDFSFYTQNIPSCFFRLGIRNEKEEIIHGVHHPQFDLDKNALKIGTESMVYLTIRALD